MTVRAFLVLALFGTVVAQAQNPRPVPTEMKGLAAALVAKTTEYVLDPAYAESGFEKELKQGKGKEPDPPAVDLELVLTNTGTEPIEIRPGNDGQILELTLEGPGAVTCQRRLRLTANFLMGEPLVIAPGGSHALPIKRLAFGMRGISKYAYWTKAGNYKLGALLRLPEPNAGKFALAKPIALRIVAE